MLGKPAQIGITDADQDVDVASATEKRPADEHFRQDDPGGELVGLLVQLASEHLLWRHVAELALQLPLLGPSLEGSGSRDAEVAELDRAGSTDEHVARRDVAVD